MAESVQKVFLYSQGGKPAYGIKKYIVDNASGIEELPKDVRPGCSCLVIETGDVYIMNGEQKWVKSNKSSGGSSEGSSAEAPEVLSAEEIEAIFDEVIGG